MNSTEQREIAKHKTKKNVKNVNSVDTIECESLPEIEETNGGSEDA